MCGEDGAGSLIDCAFREDLPETWRYDGFCIPPNNDESNPSNKGVCAYFDAEELAGASCSRDFYIDNSRTQVMFQNLVDEQGVCRSIEGTVTYEGERVLSRRVQFENQEGGLSQFDGLGVGRLESVSELVIRGTGAEAVDFPSLSHASESLVIENNAGLEEIDLARFFREGINAAGEPVSYERVSVINNPNLRELSMEAQSLGALYINADPNVRDESLGPEEPCDFGSLDIEPQTDFRLNMRSLDTVSDLVLQHLQWNQLRLDTAREIQGQFCVLRNVGNAPLEAFFVYVPFNPEPETRVGQMVFRHNTNVQSISVAASFMEGFVFEHNENVRWFRLGNGVHNENLHVDEDGVRIENNTFMRTDAGDTALMFAGLDSNGDFLISQNSGLSSIRIEHPRGLASINPFARGLHITENDNMERIETTPGFEERTVGAGGLHIEENASLTFVDFRGLTFIGNGLPDEQGSRSLRVTGNDQLGNTDPVENPNANRAALYFSDLEGVGGSIEFSGYHPDLREVVCNPDDPTVSDTYFRNLRRIFGGELDPQLVFRGAPNPIFPGHHPPLMDLGCDD